jgi:DNA-directed RNA polymerase sigma subunit (sigma70/sigma32)
MPADKQLQRRIAQAVKERDASRVAGDARYAEALRALWNEGYSLAAIAEVLGVSRQRVHQILRGA